MSSKGVILVILAQPDPSVRYGIIPEIENQGPVGAVDTVRIGDLEGA
jgi:hypothetical protein